jgi:hypothetical protein
VTTGEELMYNPVKSFSKAHQMNLFKFHSNPESLELHDEAQESVPICFLGQIWVILKN